MSLAALALGALALLPAGQVQRLDNAIELHVAGDVEEALREYDLALPGLEDPVDQAIAHNNACTILVDLERYEDALRRCEEAQRLLAGSGESGLIADNHNNLALALQSLGELERAEAALTEALALTLADDAPELEAMTRSNLGAVLTELGRFGAASQQYRAVEERAQGDADEWTRRQAAIARVNRAVLLMNLGDRRGAFTLLDADTVGALPEFGLEIHINRAVLYAALGDPVRSLRELDLLGPDDGAAASIAVNRAIAWRLRGDLQASIAEATRAIEIARRQGDRPEETRALYQQARSYEAAGQSALARAAATSALTIAEEVGSPEAQWSTHALLARLQHAAGNDLGVDGHLDAALALVERSRATTPDLILRATFLNSQREVFETAHRLWTERASNSEPHLLARAFEVVQRAKSRSLLDALPAAETHRSVRPLSAVQEVLQDDEVLLEYFVGDDDVWRWLIRADSVEVTPLSEPDSLRRSVNALIAAVHRGDPALDLRRTVGARLVGTDVPASRLHIATDGFLHGLPFAMLGPPEDPLGISAALIYWPSGSFLTRPEPPRRHGRFAALAQPEPPATAPVGLSRSLWDTWSTPLPRAHAEVLEAERQLGGSGSIRTGSDATEQAFWRLASSSPSVLHVAAHAIVDSDPGSSAILLSPTAGSDGLLRQEEIALGAVSAQLAVLAACSTVDLSGGRTADALNSLTGAFIAAGTEAVVATRWAVGDAESAAFMQQFYYFLGRGLLVSEALREARERIIAAGYEDRPDIWAAYLVVGDAQPSLLPLWRRHWPWLVAAALLTLASASLFANRRRLDPAEAPRN